MGALVTPLHVAAVAGALLWPLAAGVAVVLWSKRRAATRTRRFAAMDGRLQSLYRTVAMKPVPQRLAMVVDALQEGEELAGVRARKGKGKAATAADL